MSDTLRLGLILAVSGGFMDAYSYICRDHVFANAQTGNIVLLGISLSERNFPGAFRYFCPVVAFVAGIILSDLIRHRFAAARRLHWRQITVLLEAALLTAVALIPPEYNLPANSLTSLACGIQVESFRKIHGHSIATTMCIGNLRSGTQYLCEYFLQKKGSSLQKSLLYYGTILCFALGAVLGYAAIRHFQIQAILFCPLLLLVVFFIMFF